MTTVLLGAVLLLTALTLLNLVLLLGVVRRLREHETRIAGIAEGGAEPEIMAPVGHRVGDFTAETVDGRQVDRATLGMPALVGFFSPACDVCHERVPDFRKAAEEHLGSVLAVVIRDGKDPAELVADLDGAASVVLDEPDGPVAAAFGVRGFPAFALVGEGGVVQARGYELPLEVR